MLELPDTSSSLVLRTDYSDPAGWREMRRRIEAVSDEGFRAQVAYFDDDRLAGALFEDLIALVRRGPFRTFFFVVDGETVEHTEHPVLVVDLHEEPGRTFRVVPAQMWGVENNLSLSNMDFSEFANNADADGIFRGFR